MTQEKDKNPGGYIDEQQEQPSVNLAAPCGQVPSAASEETLRPVAGAAPTEQETPLEKLLRYCDDSDGSCYGTLSTGLVRELVTEALAAPRGTDAQILKERELTCAAIRGAMAFGHGDTNPAPAGHWLAEFWQIGADLREARQPSQCDGRGAPTAQSLPSEAALAAPSYGALPDHPCTAANVTAQAADDAAKDYVLAGWRAALRCHALHGMAGWSMYGEEFRGAALRASQQGESRE